MLQRALSSFILKIIAISLSLCAAEPLHAQKKASATATDSIPLFNGIAVSADLIGPVQLMMSSYGQYQAALRVNLKNKWFPVAEVGYGKANADDVSTKLSYQTGAPYGRLGMDWNINKEKNDSYRIYAGFRYAYTSFKYDIDSHGVIDPVWKKPADFSAHHQQASQHWLELVFALDAKLWGALRMGWSVRYKRRLFHQQQEIGEPWYVPGFGRNGNSRLGGEFNITIEL